MYSQGQRENTAHPGMSTQADLEYRLPAATASLFRSSDSPGPRALIEFLN